MSDVNFDIGNVDFNKGDGLVPAIIQDAQTLQVLMLGYMSREACAKTIETGLVTFYSRSRKTLWTKGETSGNTLALVGMKLDCDQDTILVAAKPAGPTCHTGTVSCFGDQGATGLGWLAHLGSVIDGRADADPKSSYTASLLQGPLTRTAQKVGEEGVETVIAALAQSDGEFISESSDLLYHLMVLLRAKNFSLDDLIVELQSRHQ